MFLSVSSVTVCTWCWWLDYYSDRQEDALRSVGTTNIFALSPLRAATSKWNPNLVFQRCARHSDEMRNKQDLKHGQRDCCEIGSREYLQHSRGDKVRRAVSQEASVLHWAQLKVNGWSVFPYAYTLFKTLDFFFTFKSFPNSRTTEGPFEAISLGVSMGQPSAKKKINPLNLHIHPQPAASQMFN